MSADVAAATFMRWLVKRLTSVARGEDREEVEVEPSGAFWLGRLAPEESVAKSGWGSRGERLDPCAVGIRVKPEGPGPWAFEALVSARAWLREPKGRWLKTAPVEIPVRVLVPDARPSELSFGQQDLTEALADVCGQKGLSAVVRVEVESGPDGEPELVITLVNCGPAEHDSLKDTNLYETSLSLRRLGTKPFLLESLPDSFRYDREVQAYGVNCGVEVLDGGVFRTADIVEVDKGRSSYWNVAEPESDLSFATLKEDPLPVLESLVRAFEVWVEASWSNEALDERAAKWNWDEGMRLEAANAALGVVTEAGRLRSGLDALKGAPQLALAFRLMNEAMQHASRGRYERWRPFQIGFVLSMLPGLIAPGKERDHVDTIWFATGGGKTETYLALLVTAALYDRLRGKTTGVTAWTRFPLRMLSLQQTQRFADALAGAELARRGAGIDGDPFSLGFLIGEGATPNSIKPDPPEGRDQADPDDDEMPERYRVLLTCPFCSQEQLAMVFNRRLWRLEHRCPNSECSWPGEALPFYVVDEEIYRYLPTVVVGTLDKAASIALQAAMRGLVGPPHGVCSEPGHGNLYAPRSTRSTGCLVPGCSGSKVPLPMTDDLYAPTFRLQDELHLLRDSLGAVDSHYESLLDHLQRELGGTLPKVIASSATLSGYEKQVEVLYGREGRVFPQQGPDADRSFWAAETAALARRYVALAPRGVTLEFASDRCLTELQSLVRRLKSDPIDTCLDIGVDPSHADHLLSIYGVNVVYGNTLRDVEATARSLETQVQVTGPLNTATLTGRTPFDEVRQTLHRLQEPEEDFDNRLHVVAASSMMSHGVDIDRLNVMVMLGLPLATAEFIQATARVGRRWPGLVLVLHRMGREREAGAFRAFPQFVRHGDRFVEPIPITRRSRRVLELTVSGLELARVLAIHEPRSLVSLATVPKLREYFDDAGVTPEAEVDALVKALGFTEPLDEAMAGDLAQWMQAFFRNLRDPAGTVRWPAELSVTGPPMRSLRDVEEQAPVRSYEEGNSVRVSRGRSQILFGFLPQQTVDLDGRVWKVHSWREPVPKLADLDNIRRALLRASAPWEDTKTDDGYIKDLYRSGNIEIVTLNGEAGVKVEAFPKIWLCKRCRRVSNSRSRVCRCGSRAWGQFQFVGYHDCGALREPYMPRCKVHDDLQVVFPGTSSAAEIRFVCPSCNKTMRKGFGRVRCTCGEGDVRFTVHRAAAVYTPRSMVLVNPPDPNRTAALKAAGGPARALNWILDGLRTATPADMGLTAAMLTADLIGKGLSQHMVEAMVAAAEGSGELTVGEEPDLSLMDASARALAEQEAADIAMALSGSRTTVGNLVHDTSADSQLGRLYRQEYRTGFLAAGLEDVELVEKFPVLTGNFGFTRGELAAGASRLVPFRNRKGNPVVYGEAGETEALFIRLRPSSVAGWLQRLGFDLASWGTDAEARIAILAAAHMPRPEDDDSFLRSPGSAVLSLVHSYAHRLIRRLSVYAGIERNSLSEFLVPFHLGFFVYAATRGDFVLGGLQAVFETDLHLLVSDFVRSEHRCPLDPGCSQVGAACVACLHLGEPSCRFYNRYLSRATLFGEHGYIDALRVPVPSRKGA
jgi:hypothetical protein